MPGIRALRWMFPAFFVVVLGMGLAADAFSGERLPTAVAILVVTLVGCGLGWRRFHRLADVWIDDATLYLRGAGGRAELAWPDGIRRVRVLGRREDTGTFGGGLRPVPVRVASVRRSGWAEVVELELEDVSPLGKRVRFWISRNEFTRRGHAGRDSRFVEFMKAVNRQQSPHGAASSA